MEKRIIYVGLDVHKDTIAVALAEAGKRGELREYGKIANARAALRTLAAKLASHGWCLRLPELVDQDPWAQLRRPMDMIRQG